MNLKRYGYTLLLGALVFTAITPIAYVLGNDINPLALMVLVSATGTVISFAVAYAKGTLGQVRTYFTTRNGIFAILSFGILAYTLLTLIFSYVTHYVSADLLAVVYRSWPLMVVLMAPFLMRERVTIYDILGVVVGFSSLAVTLVGGTSISVPFRYLPFVFLILLGAFFDAFVSGVSKRYNYELSSSIFAYNAVSLAVFVPVALLTGSFHFSGFTLKTAIGVLILGAVQNVLLTFLFVYSFRSVRTSVAGSVFIASPFLTMLLSALFLRTPVERFYIIVAVGVAIGIVIQQMQPRTPNYIPENRGMMVYDITSAFLNTKSELIFNATKGKNRALAFPIDSYDAENRLESNLQLYNDDNCILFTDRRPAEEVTKDEIELIRDIVRPKDGKVIVVGIGDPSIVESLFARINKDIGGGIGSRGKPVG